MAPAPGGPTADQIVALASGWLERGGSGVSAADLLVRQWLRSRPASAALFNVLGRVAMTAGEPGRAAAEFARALKLDPYFKPAVKNLKEAGAKAAEPARPETDAWRRAQREGGTRSGYLVIRAWGAGFWSDVDHAMSHVLAAEITGREPVIGWGANSRWGRAGFGSAWDAYFEPMSAIGLAEVLARGGAIYPSKWTLQNLEGPAINTWHGEGSLFGGLALLNRPEEVVVADYATFVSQLCAWLPAGHPGVGRDAVGVYRDLVARRLRPRAEVIAAVGSFWRERIGEGPVLAVHLRASDKVQELPGLSAVNAAYPARVDAALESEPALRIFLLTDSTSALEEFSKRYGSRLMTTDCRRTSSATAVHFLPGIEDRYALGVEVMRDAYLAARCDRFLGLGFSNVSCMVRVLKDWPAGACELLGPDLHLNPPVSMYAPEGPGQRRG